MGFMDSGEERLRALEEKMARMETLLLGLQDRLDAEPPVRVRVRKASRFDPARAIEKAKASEARTFTTGMMVAGACAMVALIVWIGVELFDRAKDGIVVEVAGKTIVP